jgi:hypothetical protein
MADTPLTHEVLKARHRDQRDEWPQSLSLRVHRALSWLDRAEQCSDDDGRFIFLWIAFNAAYAQEFNDIERNREAKRLAAFLEKIVSLDTHKALYHLIWEQFPNTIRVLLDNQFVFPAFWEHQRGLITEEAWKDAFANANKAARAAIGAGDTAKALGVILVRLYALRNQLVHGGATWNGSVNRDQMRDCTAFLSRLVPVVISLMMDNPGTLWGDPSYPVVN